jgi:D-tagatose-1,6-bisphosphate aldolase subunit GatZ/KbaZ
LCASPKRAAAQAGLPPPVYVIGTEVPIPGGEASLAQAGGTSPAAARTLDVHRQAFFEHDLHGAWRRVIAMVVQPGVDFDHSQIQHYQADAAQSLSEFIAGQPGLVFEAHSTDYQRETALQRMVRDHFAILKVGPAATFALRSALQALCAIEAELPASQCSRLMQVLDDAMLAQPKQWLKHYPGTASEQRLLRRYGLSDRCRYYWGEASVQAAVNQLQRNLDGLQIPLMLLASSCRSSMKPCAMASWPTLPRPAGTQHRPGTGAMHAPATTTSQSVKLDVFSALATSSCDKPANAVPPYCKR